MFDRYQGGERALLLHIDFQTLNSEQNQAQIAEFVELVTSAGIQVLDLVTSRRSAPHAKFYTGSGIIEQLADLVKLYEADVIIFNHQLSPA
ncbi:MAG: GTPase HflX, partial [Gammaproteobacteria bacterium]